MLNLQWNSFMGTPFKSASWLPSGAIEYCPKDRCYHIAKADGQAGMNYWGNRMWEDYDKRQYELKGLIKL